MKILLINHFPLVGSGSGVYVANIARSLERKGHEVCIILPENTTQIDNITNVKIHPVYFTREEKIEGQLDFNFPCMDPHPRSNFLFNNMTEEQVKQYENAFKKAIEEEIREFQPDVIHSGHVWILSSVATDFEIPVVITSHGPDITGVYESDKFHKQANKAAKECKRIIAISNDNKEKLNKIYNQYRDKIIFMPNGYHPDVFYRENCNKEEVLKSFQISKTYDKIVCFAGRLNKNKGVDILLRSAKMYEEKNVLTLIAGFGDEFEALNQLKQELGLQNVVFVKNQSHANLRKIYSISDVCVVPSRQEAFGLVALEAIACGTPVIATKQGGMVDFITKEVGILVEREDVNQLAKAIKQIIKEEIKFDKQYLQNYAQENYAQETLMDQLIDVYEEIRRK